MNPTVASAICALGIAGLLYLDREKTVKVSYALWIPGLWIGIVGSRPVSLWLGFEQPGNLGLDGSPADAAVFGVLLLMGVAVLVMRRKRARTLLLANWPILIYFLFCFVSIMWSSHPDVSFKRWTKAIGDLVMALIIATDRAPAIALRRLVSRIGMVLLPTSVLFIFYFGDLGRGYTSDGLPMNTGLTTNKNSLGLIVLVVSLVVLWNVRHLFIHKDEPNRGRRLAAQGILLAFGLELFLLADCSTCKACFILGNLLILLLNLRAFRGRPARVHAFCLAMLIVAGIALSFGGQAQVANALGRQSHLSGRTEIWAALIPAASNVIVGDGFESFWNSPNADLARETLVEGGFSPVVIRGLQEAHNGYLEIYLQLGFTGVCLIAFVIISGYDRACRAYRRDPELAGLFIAYLIVGAVYSITEAGFRTMIPSWIFLLTSVVGATAVTHGLSGREIPVPASRSTELNLKKQAVPAAWHGWNSLDRNVALATERRTKFPKR